MPGKDSNFSQFSGQGKKYAPKKKATKRTPRRDKQVARGHGDPGKSGSSEPAYVKQARRDMGHGRTRKDWGQ